MHPPSSYGLVSVKRPVDVSKYLCIKPLCIQSQYLDLLLCASGCVVPMPPFLSLWTQADDLCFEIRVQYE